MSAGLTKVARVRPLVTRPVEINDERWPADALKVLPQKARELLRGKKFNSGFTKHPHALQVQFRPLEELATAFPDEVDIAGKKSNHLTAIEFHSLSPVQDKNGSGFVHYDIWRIKCDCGNERELHGNKIREGKQQSCSRTCPLKRRRKG